MQARKGDAYNVVAQDALHLETQLPLFPDYSGLEIQAINPNSLGVKPLVNGFEILTDSLRFSHTLARLVVKA